MEKVAVMSSDDQLAAVFEKYRRYPEFFGVEILTANQLGNFGNTLLHLAARAGAIDDMQILVAAKADPNIRGDIGNTPLHSAALHGQVEAVRRLLGHGANPNIVNDFYETALDVAETNSAAAKLGLEDADELVSVEDSDMIISILRPLTRKQDKDGVHSRE
jgi:uncharacterized protein